MTTMTDVDEAATNADRSGEDAPPAVGAAAASVPSPDRSGGVAGGGGRTASRRGRPHLVRSAPDAILEAGLLDPSQRAAAAARGPLVRVLGGPGTGKSTVAAHAVLDRVADGTVAAHEALVLAPTRTAAARLRHQVATSLRATTSTPSVSSVQAFAYGLLRRRAAVEGEPLPRLLSGPEQDVILRELLSGHEAGLGRRPAWPAELTEATRTRGFRAELRDLLMRCVEHGLDAHGLTALAVREDKPVWAACAQVLAEYDEVTALSTPGGYDPAWILTAAADLLEDEPQVSEQIHDEVRVVVVDDAQELTAPAARLVGLLRSGRSEIVLIGDPDVAAQTFRGADPRLMMDEPATHTRVLQRSWRLAPEVARVAARVAQRIGVAGQAGHRLGPDGHARGTDPGAADDTRSADAPPSPAPDAPVTQNLDDRRPVSATSTGVVQPTLFDVLDPDSGAITQPFEAAEAPGLTGTTRGAVARVGRQESPAEPAAVLPARGGATDRSRHRVGAEECSADDTPHPKFGAAVHPPTDAVETAVLPSATAEARFVSARLRRAHLLHGIPYARMAVIVRGAGRSATLRRVLAGDGIPVDIPGARVPLRDEPAVRPLLALYEAALEITSGDADGISAETILDLLASPLGATDSLAIRRLLRALRRAERRRLDRARASVPVDDNGDASLDDPGEAALDAVTGAVRSTDELLEAVVLGDALWADLEEGAPSTGLRRIHDTLAAGIAAARRAEGTWAPGVTAETVLWAMWEASGLAEPWRAAALAGSQRADRDLDAVVALTDAAARYVDRLPQRGPDGFLEHVRGQDVAGDTLVARAPSDDCVTLTTPAGAAGLEWDLVVVAGLQEGAWPDLRLRGSVLGSGELVDVVTGRGRSTAGAREDIRSDETRLFLLAVSRTRGALLCTAVRDEEETPSPFLDLVDEAHDMRPYAAQAVPMTLPEVVAALRRVVSGQALAAEAGEGSAAEQHAERVPDADAAEAARLLARLERAGLRGAHPDDWWGLREVSDDRPRRSDTDRLAVSPSKVEAFARCELRWLLTSSGGQTGASSVATALGTLVHDIAAEVDNGDYPAMVAELDRRWNELDLPEGWIARRQYDKATAMLDRLARLHSQSRAAGWEVVGTEIDVSVPLGRALVRGRVDRLERDAEGRLRVVDLKTGSSSSKPKNDDLPRLPQLGAYQVAVEGGAFAEHGTVSAGAALMQIGEGGGKQGALQEQGPLRDDDDPNWARELLENTARGMAGATYRARAGTWCRVCESRFSCPIQPEGETLR